MGNLDSKGSIGDVVRRTLLATAGGIAVMTLPGCANPGPAVAAAGAVIMFGDGKVNSGLEDDNKYLAWWYEHNGQKDNIGFSAPRVAHFLNSGELFLPRITALPYQWEVGNPFVILEVSETTSRQSRYTAAVFQFLREQYKADARSAVLIVPSLKAPRIKFYANAGKGSVCLKATEEFAPQNLYAARDVYSRAGGWWDQQNWEPGTEEFHNAMEIIKFLGSSEKDK